MDYKDEIYTEYKLISVDGQTCGWTHDSKDPLMKGSALEYFERAFGYSRADLDRAFENNTTIIIEHWSDMPFKVHRYLVNPRKLHVQLMSSK